MSKSGSSIAYGYNADGKRISKIVNGTTYRQLQPHDGPDRQNGSTSYHKNASYIRRV